MKYIEDYIDFLQGIRHGDNVEIHEIWSKTYEENFHLGFAPAKRLADLAVVKFVFEK
jgi:hypothetical protein